MSQLADVQELVDGIVSHIEGLEAIACKKGLLILSMACDAACTELKDALDEETEVRSQNGIGAGL